MNQKKQQLAKRPDVPSLPHKNAQNDKKAPPVTIL